MKNRLYSASIASAVLMILFFLSGCSKKEVTQFGQFGLHLSTQIDTNTVAVEGQLYPDHNGRLMAINDARFYISSVSLQKTDGSWYTIPGSLLLKTYEKQDYNITSVVPSGNYSAIKFYVGLDSLTNAINPAVDSNATNQDSVLSSTLEPNMYFGAGEGFKFFYFSGYILPSGSHSPVAVNYQIGGNANRQLVTMSGLNFTVSQGRVHFVSIVCDYGKLFEGITISNSLNGNGNSFGNTAQANTATLVADSIPNMFSYVPFQP